MKKYEHLGKSLSREEQKSIGGGFAQYANTMCSCLDNPSYSVPLCGSDCLDVYSQCDTYCGGSGNVFSYGTCTLLESCL